MLTGLKLLELDGAGLEAGLGSLGIGRHDGYEVRADALAPRLDLLSERVGRPWERRGFSGTLSQRLDSLTPAPTSHSDSLNKLI